MHYVIFSLRETQKQVPSAPMFWNEDSGTWVALSESTVYTQKVSDAVVYPDAQWVQLPELE
jgi:hypothetical protein